MPRKFNYNKLSQQNRLFMRTLDQTIDRRQGKKESSEKEFTLEEIYKLPDCSSLRDLRAGKRKGMLNISAIQTIASYLECEPQELIDLLDSAGYPIHSINPKDNELNNILITSEKVLKSLPVPAYVIDRNWDVHFWNKIVLDLFNIKEEYLKSIADKNNLRDRNEKFNIFQLVFHPDSPIHKNMRKNESSWRNNAGLSLYWFRRDNKERWDSSDIRKFMDKIEELYEFKSISEYIRTYRPKRGERFMEYITEIPAKDNQILRVRGLRIRFSPYEFPRIITHVPEDDETRDYFIKNGYFTLGKVSSLDDL